MSALLRVVPLGGLGQIGRNMMALECGDDIVVIDSGLMFPEHDMLGIDLVIPDITWLLERAARVRAICLTHGHEDHIGALPYVLPRLNAPVYGTALTLGFLRNKLREHRLIDSAQLHTVTPGETRAFGGMSVEWIHTTHSIPDSCALAIRTAAGTVIHTGDFKLDQTPILGQPPDLARMARIGDDGVLLLLSDSTNADADGYTASERHVGEALPGLFAGAQGRILMATFASNISRLQQAITAAEDLGRKVFIVGRSMLNNVRVAQELGYLRVNPDTFVSPRQMERVPDNELAVLCTGAQGEPLSALTRIAAREHPMVQIREGDTVILSANPIPGNEEAVHRTINALYRRGARVLAGSRHHVHASGHASREELKLLLTLIRPKYFIPVHGEYRHLTMHAELGRAVGIPAENVMCIDNGTIIEIDEDGVRRPEERAPVGYVYVDGLQIAESGEVTLRDRRELAHDGVVIVVLTVERASGSVVAGPDLVARGFLEDGHTEALFDQAREEVAALVRRLERDADWTVWQTAIREQVARLLFRETRRRPMVLPVITEL